MKHHCTDGTLYTWTSRVKEPKACPRCKQRMDVGKNIPSEIRRLKKQVSSSENTSEDTPLF